MLAKHLVNDYLMLILVIKSIILGVLGNLKHFF